MGGKDDYRRPRMFLFPSRSSNKHKKNKYYVSHNNTSPPTRSIMSSNTPPSHDTFDFSEPHTSLTPASTSRDDNMLSTTLLLEERTKRSGYEPLSSPEDEPRANDNGQEEETPALEPHANHETSNSEDKEEFKKLNGGSDKLDDAWMPAVEEKNPNEDDFCIKCLYFSMQCCECSIM